MVIFFILSRPFKVGRALYRGVNTTGGELFFNVLMIL